MCWARLPDRGHSPVSHEHQSVDIGCGALIPEPGVPGTQDLLSRGPDSVLEAHDAGDSSASPGDECGLDSGIHAGSVRLARSVGRFARRLAAGQCGTGRGTSRRIRRMRPARLAVRKIARSWQI
jgi:hypothetical protein